MSDHQDHLEHLIALLERTPGALDELLRGLPSEWIDANEGGDSWSPREVVAHLSHAESTNWIEHLLAHGESQPFPTFNREGGRDACTDQPIAELLDEFTPCERRASRRCASWESPPATWNAAAYTRLWGRSRLSSC